MTSSLPALVINYVCQFALASCPRISSIDFGNRTIFAILVKQITSKEYIISIIFHPCGHTNRFRTEHLAEHPKAELLAEHGPSLLS